MEIHPAVVLLLKLFKGGAIDGVDHHPATAITDSDNSLAGYRLTAGRAPERLIGLKANHGARNVDLIALYGSKIRIHRLDDLSCRQFR